MLHLLDLRSLCEGVLRFILFVVLGLMLVVGGRGLSCYCFQSYLLLWHACWLGRLISLVFLLEMWYEMLGMSMMSALLFFFGACGPG